MLLELQASNRIIDELLEMNCKIKGNCIGIQATKNIETFYDREIDIEYTSRKYSYKNTSIT